MAKNYCVMTMGKRHRSDVRGLQKEANREFENDEKYKNNVDLSRTKDNIYLIKSDDWNESIDEVLEENGITERRDSVVLVTSVYAVSSDWLKSHSEEDAMQYFANCLQWEMDNKGQVINAVIHMDEDTPHMQVATVPLVRVRDVKSEPVMIKNEKGEEVQVLDKKGRKKYKNKPKTDENGNFSYHMGLSAKNVFGNKVKMSKMQTDFWQKCGKELGMERGEIRIEDDEEAKKRLTEAEYKAGKIVEDAESKREAIYAEEKAKANKEADELREQLKKANKELEQRKEIMGHARIKLTNGKVYKAEEFYHLKYDKAAKEEHEKQVNRRLQEEHLEEITQQYDAKQAENDGMTAIQRAMSAGKF